MVKKKEENVPNSGLVKRGVLGLFETSNGGEGGVEGKPKGETVI